MHTPPGKKRRAKGAGPKPRGTGTRQTKTIRLDPATLLLLPATNHSDWIEQAIIEKHAREQQK